LHGIANKPGASFNFLPHRKTKRLARNGSLSCKL
jgi:hypothetical protein